MYWLHLLHTFSNNDNLENYVYFIHRREACRLTSSLLVYTYAICCMLHFTSLVRSSASMPLLHRYIIFIHLLLSCYSPPKLYLCFHLPSNILRKYYCVERLRLFYSMYFLKSIKLYFINTQKSSLIAIDLGEDQVLLICGVTKLNWVRKWICFKLRDC